MRRWALTAAIVLMGVVVAVGLGSRMPAMPRAVGDQACTAAIGLILLDDEAGLYVLGVTDGSLASSAGIRPGDILTMAHDTPLSTTAQLEELLARQPADAPIPITVARQEQTMIVRLTLR